MTDDEDDVSLEPTDEDVEYCRRHHREWADVWKRIDENPLAAHEIEGPDGPVNPVLHVQMDAVARWQVKHDEPKGITSIYHQVTAVADEFDGYHAIARAIVEEMHAMMTEKRRFDIARYLSRARQHANEWIRHLRRR